MSDEVDESRRAALRRVAALGAAGPLAALGSDGATADVDVDVNVDTDGGSGDTDTREAVAGYVHSAPGVHLSKVRDDLGVGTGTAQYHLRRLVDDNALESHRDGDYRRFYPAGQFSTLEKRVLGQLRRETARGVLVELLSDPTASAGDLASRLDVSRPTVSDRAADLERAGLLDRTDYSLRHPETVLVLVLRYADSLGPRARRVAREADDLLRYDPTPGSRS
ncbi:MarR family transcriptional regulator [Halobacteriales archaeon SW_5_70_135]|nr:MAG: MarR family transcriptional regulator [Halobacteriales archaeon SW_5_70_135]